MKVVVAGLINIETTLKVDAFPIEYSPVHYPFFGVESTVSGVGLNVAKALVTLGCSSELLSLVGKDRFGKLSVDVINDTGIVSGGVLQVMDETPQSVILYDEKGRRQINVDLKDIQSRKYPPEKFSQAADGAGIACLCNINFSRPLLSDAKNRHMKIATDVHVFSDIDDQYNHEFAAAADILFLSNEGIISGEIEFLRKLKSTFSAEVICIGMGSKGVLMYTRNDDTLFRYSAVSTRPVVNTIGAGDALFSAFVFYYGSKLSCHEAMLRAILFASYKIGEKGAADGFASSELVENLYDTYGRGITCDRVP